MNKALKLFSSVLLATGVLTGCSKPNTESQTASSPAESSEKELNIMFVVTGSLGGGTNNDDVYSALTDYTTEFGGEVKTFECNMDTSLYETTLQQAAETAEFDLIVTGFGTMVEPLGNVAAKFPDQKFLIFDTAMNFEDGKNANVISVQVLQNQGAFLVGALSALMTKSDAEFANADLKVGFVGAMESVAIQDCLIGYIEGVKYVDESVDVLYSFVGNHQDSAVTKEMALTQNQNGADVVYGVSQSDLAVADAALEKGFYAVCSDADDAMKIADTSKETAQHIMTSVIKDYYNMVFPMVKEIGAGTAEFGKHKSISYADGGVKLADNEYFNSAVPEAVQTEFKGIVDKMMAGEIEVDTAYGATTEMIDSVKARATANN